MDESGRSNKKADVPSDWELLSMSMTGSSAADLKSALAAAEAASSHDSSSGVADLTMHSQYFGHGSPPGGIFARGSDEGAGKQADSAKAEEGKAEVEQQILVSALSSPRSSEAAMGFGDSGQGSREIKPEGEIVAAEMVVAATIVKAPAKEKSGSKEWIKRRLQIVTKKVNRSSTLWSIAFVATVTGLILLGKRWYYDRLKNLDLELEALASEEKISEAAHEIPDISDETIAEPAAEPSSLFGILRDIW